MTVVKRAMALLAALALAAAALVVGPVLVGAPAAQAADNGEWSAFPKTEGGRGVTPREYFFYDVAPGQQLRDTVVVRNNTTVPLPLTLYGADAFNTEQGGGFALKLRDDEQKDVGSWIELDRTEITVPPARTNKKGEPVPGKREVGFTLRVPRNASPGDHAGGVVTIDLRPRVDPSQPGSQIAVQRANGVRVYARVSGPLNAQLGVSDVSFNNLDAAVLPLLGDQGGTDVEFTVVNNGNVRINPTATLKITGLLGRELHKVEDVTVPEILPGESVTLVEHVDGMPALDQVKARVELSSEALSAPTAGDETAWSVSWVFVGVLLVLLVLLVAYVVHRRRQPARTVQDAPAAEPDVRAEA